MVFSSLFQPAGQSLSWCICDLQGRRNRKHFWKMVSPLVKRSIVWSKNPPYSDYHKQLKIIVVLLNFQRKSKRHVAVAKKNWGGKGEWIMFVALTKSHFVWNVSQKLSKDWNMWILQKGTDILCWYHVDETSYWMLKRWSQTSSDVFLFKWKSYMEVLISCVCNTPNFVIQLLWSYNFSFFSQLKLIF